MAVVYVWCVPRGNAVRARSDGTEDEQWTPAGVLSLCRQCLGTPFFLDCNLTGISHQYRLIYPYEMMSVHMCVVLRTTKTGNIKNAYNLI